MSGLTLKSSRSKSTERKKEKSSSKTSRQMIKPIPLSKLNEPISQSKLNFVSGNHLYKLEGQKKFGEQNSIKHVSFEDQDDALKLNTQRVVGKGVDASENSMYKLNEYSKKSINSNRSQGSLGSLQKNSDKKKDGSYKDDGSARSSSYHESNSMSISKSKIKMQLSILAGGKLEQNFKKMREKISNTTTHRSGIVLDKIDADDAGTFVHRLKESYGMTYEGRTDGIFKLYTFGPIIGSSSRCQVRFCQKNVKRDKLERDCNKLERKCNDHNSSMMCMKSFNNAGKSTSTQFVMKIVSKYPVKGFEQDYQNFWREVQIMKLFRDHPNMVHIHEIV